MVSNLSVFQEELQEAANAFIQTLGGRRKPEWTKIAAVFSAFHPDVTRRLLQFSSRMVFLASALSHPEIFTCPEAKKDLEKGVDSTFKNLTHPAAKIVIRALISAIEDAGSLACIEDFLSEKAVIRRLMEVLRSGGSRKRTADGKPASSPSMFFTLLIYFSPVISHAIIQFVC